MRIKLLNYAGYATGESGLAFAFQDMDVMLQLRMFQEKEKREMGTFTPTLLFREKTFLYPLHDYSLSASPDRAGNGRFKIFPSSMSWDIRLLQFYHVKGTCHYAGQCKISHCCGATVFVKPLSLAMIHQRIPLE